MGQAVAMLVCVAGPAAVAVLVHRWSSPESMANIDIILAYLSYLFLIPLFSCAVVFLRGHGAASFQELFGTLANIVKLGTFSLAFAVLLPNAALLLKAAAARLWRGGGRSDG